MEHLEDQELPTLELSEVREGDLVFTARPGRLQTLCELAGDPWRHVGVVTEVDGVLSSSEVAGHKFQHRPLHRIAAAPHTAVGIARFPDEHAGCASKAATWVNSMLAKDNLYAWDDLILTGILLLVRRRAPASMFDEVMKVIQSAEQLAREVPPPSDQRSFTCASFAFHAFAQAGADCRPSVEIEPVRTRPGRFRDEGPAQAPPLAELISDAERGDFDALTEPLERFSLLELSGVEPAREGPRTRFSATSRMNAEQFATIARSLARIVASVTTSELPPKLVLDERWVSPGDLWRLDNLSLRALLPIAEIGP